MQDEDEFQDYLRRRTRRVRRGSWLLLTSGVVLGIALSIFHRDVSTLIFRSAEVLVFLLLVIGVTLLRFSPRQR